MDRDSTRHVTIDIAGLKAILERTFFADWVEFDLVDAETLAAARDRIRLTIHKLIESGPSAPVGTVLAIFQWCIEEFNRHDEEAQWICTRAGRHLRNSRSNRSARRSRGRTGNG